MPILDPDYLAKYELETISNDRSNRGKGNKDNKLFRRSITHTFDQKDYGDGLSDNSIELKKGTKVGRKKRTKSNVSNKSFENIRGSIRQDLI